MFILELPAIPPTTPPTPPPVGAQPPAAASPPVTPPAQKLAPQKPDGFVPANSGGINPADLRDPKKLEAIITDLNNSSASGGGITAFAQIAKLIATVNEIKALAAKDPVIKGNLEALEKKAYPNGRPETNVNKLIEQKQAALAKAVEENKPTGPLQQELFALKTLSGLGLTNLPLKEPKSPSDLFEKADGLREVIGNSLKEFRRLEKETLDLAKQA